MAEETGSSFHPIPALGKNLLEKESKWKRHKSNTEKSFGGCSQFSNIPVKDCSSFVWLL